MYKVNNHDLILENKKKVNEGDLMNLKFLENFKKMNIEFPFFIKCYLLWQVFQSNHLAHQGKLIQFPRIDSFEIG